jgi:FtsH-binding integral membrane protein
MNHYSTPSKSQTRALPSFMNWVYLWMSLGLLLSAGIAYAISTHLTWQMAIIHNQILFLVLIVAQLGCVFAFRTIMSKCSAQTLALLFLFYCALSGVTFSAILYLYTKQVITQAFFATAGSFFGLSLFGFTTKKDLSGLGHFCFIGLVGILISSVLAFFMPSMNGYVGNMVISTIGVMVFAGLMAYDTQKIKYSYQQNSDIPVQKLALSGALTLYLDFINMFIFLLRLFSGGRR